MANYHPYDELLMSFAAGQLPNSLGLMVSCHLEKCSACRDKVKTYEALGGDILAEAEQVDVSQDLLSRMLDRLDEPEPANDRLMGQHSSQGAGSSKIPRPLRRFIPSDFDELEWSGMSRNIKEFTLKIDDEQYTTKLYRIKAGKVLPEHTHEGNEFTLVMEGSFSDRTCDYHAGDFILADTKTTHQPRAAMDSDCICLAVMDAPLKMTGMFGRMLNPFLR